MIGNKYGKWTVLGDMQRDERGNKIWPCQCVCGTKSVIKEYSLKSGGSKSCGCSKKQHYRENMSTHGMYGTKMHSSWEAMKNRCLNPKSDSYHLYGGRGIKICESWMNFQNFYNDMGKPGFDDFQLDRINTDGHYEPSNCRWVTVKQNMRNRRNNALITYNGRTQCLSAWAEELGMNQTVLWGRLRKYRWTLERAMTQPLQHHRRNKCE